MGVEIYVPWERLKAKKEEIKARLFPDRATIHQSFLEDPHNQESLRIYVIRRWENCMNNFHFLIPEPRNNSVSKRRGDFTYLRIMDRSVREVCGELAKEYGSGNQGLSELVLSQTHREFLDTVESVIQLYNPDLEEVWNFFWHNSDPRSAMGYNRLVLPIFIHLRALGYDGNELTM